MNRFRQIVAAGVFALLACAMAAPALAQQRATVSGVVTDPLGARVPNATVTLSGGPESKETRSGNDGTYTFANVAPGLYQVVAALSGFQPFSSGPTYVGGAATHDWGSPVSRSRPK